MGTMNSVVANGKSGMQTARVLIFAKTTKLPASDAKKADSPDR
jgi:hypothetical protein